MTPLLAHRKTTTVTQKELADAVGVDQSHIAGIESGRHCPSAPVARKISDFFGGAVTLEQLLFPAEHAVEMEKAS